MPSACERFIQTTLLGALLLPLAWAARPVFEFDEGSSPSSFAQQSEHAHATLTVNEIEKFEVVQISKKEMIRLRTQGMRLHEVKHRHFNRDPKGPNSMHEEYEEDENEDSNEEVFSVTPRGQFKAAPSKKHIADALLEKEAGNATVDGSFPKSVKTCPEHVKSQWYDLSFAIRDKGNGHVYLTCEGQADGDELKASCIPKECGGDAWCFVKRGCGGIRGRCRKMDGVDPRQCQKASTTESLDNDGGRGGTTATTTTTGKPSTESEAFAPPLKISPSQMTGYVCAQFDLDLTMLSGGVFPGMFSVGLLGDVHYIPSTQCWGWTNELYLQFSLGLDIGGVNFRISFVFIATLVVTEQPLNAARDQLSWELPYKLDTSVCHTKDPFTLIERTLKRQWKYILTHVLTLRETPEEKVATALENYDKENNFAQYVPLLQQDGAPRKYQLLGPKGTIAEDTETEALVKPGSKEAGLLRMNITRADKTITVQIGVAEVPDDVEMLKLIVWQDWDAMIARQESNLFRLVDMAGNFKTDQITWSFQLRGHSIVVGAVHLLSSGGSKTHIGPFTIGTKSYVKVGPIRHGEDPMWQKTGFLRQLDIGFREFLGREVGHTGTLAITSFNITKHNCRHQPEFARVSIKAAADRVEEATWYWKDMGSKAPWGVHVTRKHGMEDLLGHAE
ncbi:unnamed protein product [Prorocentrum cordatum]|uniref:Uncharacterized protein n=1 Tax=Prorocentrum cordatum TaxID=2364126 RepID=A0ABN9SBV4_9DINO|nr:unnamed protein product [Polarella glacialis]